MVSSGRLPLERLDCEANKDSSSDTAKENASVVDSSLTECKHDMENWDDPGSSSYKINEECYPPTAEEPLHSPVGVGNLSATRNDKLYTTRYFIIKSLNHHNIELSIEKGIWATQVMNEPILEEAFRNSGKVILIFSVNMSGFFQGYAQMMSSVGWRRDNVWSQASGGNNPWGRSFEVKWLRLHNLPFQKTLHLKNPLNDYKPVKISRDCQELSPDIGEALCGLLDNKIDVDGKLKRCRNNFSRDDVLLKRPCIEPLGSLQDEDYFHNVPPLHMAWARTPTLYPSLPYQHVTQSEASNFHLAHGRSPEGFIPENLPTTFGASKGTQMNYSLSSGNPTNVQGNRDMSFQLDSGGLTAERSPLASSLSEDDFLEMSYEEYLEVHGRNNRPSRHPAAGPSTSKGYDDDSYTRYLNDWHCSQKRTYNSSHR